MQKKKYRKFYIEWWKIRSSTFYSIGIFIVVAALIFGGGWWAIRNNWFAQKGVSEISKDASRVISFEGDVRITRAATRETILVTKITYVTAGDTIQTQSDGRAIIQMIDGSIYSVRPNSTVVIRDISSIFGGKNVRVSLDDGQLNVRTGEQPANTENVVEMLDSETRLRSQTNASFNTDVETNGGEIRISRGSVETTIGGESATINSDEFAAVNNGRISTKEKLLPPPASVSPANLSQIVDTSGAGATVSFNWEDAGGMPVSGYHFQVAKSPVFDVGGILIDRSGLAASQFRVAGFDPGTYYWRLKSTSQTGQTSDWSEPWKITVVKRETSSAIEASEWNVENVGGNIYILSGKTQPGLRVRSQSREAFASADGSFRIQISTPLSEVLVELNDGQGNRASYILSVRSSKVLRRF